MGKKVQISKNIELTHRFIEYLVKGTGIPDLPDDVSFVPFSKTDKKLNEVNEELLETLSTEEKPIAKVEEPETKTGSWKITPVNF